MKNIHDWKNKKKSHEKITMVTCYDACFANIIANTAIDAVLIGDTLAEVIHGYKSTVHANLDMMVLHCRAVARQLNDKFIVGDLPFLSYRKNLTVTMNAVERLMDTGINALKLEGGKGNYDTIKHITESGIPVMGHIGLTPQSIHQLGGYRVQGRLDEQAQELLNEAQELENAGCFAVVLECVPRNLAKAITDSLSIPTIGIGAGPEVDGQILVLHDLLGLTGNFSPKFLKHYANGFNDFQKALDHYHQDVVSGEFPAVEHSY